MPVECRGLFSGFLQLGYPVGYLIIASVNLNSTVKQQGNWRYLFYTGAGFSFACALFRLCLPESAYFREHKRRQAADLEEQRRRDGPLVDRRSTNRLFVREFLHMLRSQWLRCLFGILLMTGMNFYSHGSQDLYPTYLQVGKGFDSRHTTLATIIGNCGAIVGCAMGGYTSQYLGRRLTIIVFCVFCCCMIPLWLIPTTFAPLAVGAAMVQAGVQGAYGVIPVYLSEISPPAFRAMWPGVGELANGYEGTVLISAYQIGNMVSSASAQIEATAGERLKDHVNGRPAYGKVSAILIAVSHQGIHA
jgi:SHS family lactate transporter-like MFS transporter